MSDSAHSTASSADRRDRIADGADRDSMPMPPGPAGVGQPVVIAPPPTFGQQMAQLVVIPAGIVILAIGVALIFGKLAGSTETLESQLNKLRQSSGAGTMRFGIQDPRYKDRGLAAYNIATMIPGIKDPQRRREVSAELVQILEQNVGPEEDLLHVYLLTAIGQLGQDDAFPNVARRLDSPRPVIQQGAIRGVLSWPDEARAREAVPRLAALLRRDQPEVQAEAAAALGKLAQPSDPGVVEALRSAMASPASAQREVRWNSAVALARLNDPQGSAVVANLLLDRDSLAKLPAGESGAAAAETMPRAMQDRLLLATLASAPQMKDEAIWDKIAELAQGDPNPRIKTAAHDLLRRRDAEAADGADAGGSEPALEAAAVGRLRSR